MVRTGVADRYIKQARTVNVSDVNESTVMMVGNIGQKNSIAWTAVAELT